MHIAAIVTGLNRSNKQRHENAKGEAKDGCFHDRIGSLVGPPPSILQKVRSIEVLSKSRPSPMPKDSDAKIAVVALIAFTAWLFVGLPLLYLPSQVGEGNMIWGTVPQWLTALIAGGALFAAVVSISSQREIARKRAAMDFFAKTEMDRDTLASHKKFTDAVAMLDTHLKAGNACSDFVSTPEYWHIRDYLNLHELMAVGVRNDVFDDNVCFNFWSRELGDAYRRTKPLIEYIQTKEADEQDTYTELVSLALRWLEKEPAVRRALHHQAAH